MDVRRQEHAGLPFYACDGFGPGVGHAFSTRLGGVSTGRLTSLNLAAVRGDDPQNVGENFRRLCAAAGCDHLALVKNHQVHGDVVRSVTGDDIMPGPDAPGLFPADALVTDQVGTCLTIFSADCIPVLLYDPVARVVAAAHAGWRGTALGIAANTVGAMVDRYGCQPRHILAAIGPGISPCCFETHGDVPDGLRQGLGADAAPFIAPLPGGEKFRVDLKGANRQWLLRCGLLPAHIALCPACTACSLDTFWSHRTQGEARGTMAAVIQLTNL